MFHLFKNLLLCVSLLLLMNGCGQKGPLFLSKQQNPAPIVAEKTAAADASTVDDVTQQPERINNINAD
jgi:predicted small lipoprotein YifL